jgi:addiction module RelE/StbE family toxin
VRVVWSDRALTDLRDIVAYIRQHNPSAARRVGHRMRNATRRLARFPLSGRMVPDLPSGDYREVIADQYRIIYRVTEGEVRIVTVVHGARDLPSLPLFRDR